MELLVKIVSLVQPLQSNASKVYTLNLHNVTMEDAGEYICMAENPTGQTVQSAWLEVLPGKMLKSLFFSDLCTLIKTYLSLKLITQ